METTLTVKCREKFEGIHCVNETVDSAGDVRVLKCLHDAQICSAERESNKPSSPDTLNSPEQWVQNIHLLWEDRRHEGNTAGKKVPMSRISIQTSLNLLGLMWPLSVFISQNRLDPKIRKKWVAFRNEINVFTCAPEGFDEGCCCRMWRRLSVQLPILHHSYLPAVGGISASNSSLWGSSEAFVHYNLMTASCVSATTPPESHSCWASQIVVRHNMNQETVFVFHYFF